MTTGTILYCFILVAVVFFIQWMIIGWYLYEINKRISKFGRICCWCWYAMLGIYQRPITQAVRNFRPTEKR